VGDQAIRRTVSTAFPARQDAAMSIRLHGRVTATLIVSLSGLGPSSLAEYTTFSAELAARQVPASWLFPPRPRNSRHHQDAAAIRWLRERISAGDALVMHGFDHTADPIGCWQPTSVAHLGRKAEFATLPEHEANLRLIAAIRAFAELGLSSDAFAPPRWLASAGTLTALRRRGFRVCADSVGVRMLDTDTLLRGRVLSTGPADGAEGLRCRAMVAAAARSARRGGLVRITADAADLVRPSPRRAVLEAVDAALVAGALPATYPAPVLGSQGDSVSA